MAKYRITSPEGHAYEITAPDNASQDQVLSYFKQNYLSSAKPSGAFEKYGKYLPTAGAIAGGLLGAGAGGLPAVGGAALGAGAGEAGRQLIGRMIGEPSPQTSGEAAKSIGIQGALGAGGEVLGQGIGAIGGALYKGLPKIGQAMSGTPARNIAKAQLRGFVETYFPSVAKWLSRDVAGGLKGAAEDKLLYQYFKPNEIADIQLRDSKVAKDIVKKTYTKWAADKSLSVREAFRAVKAVDVIYRDTPQGIKVAPELAKIRRWADTVVATAHPEYKVAKRASEATILRSQLLKPFRVNKTRPDEFSGFTGALAPMVGGALGYEAKSILPMLAGMVGTSPLAFGVSGSILGSTRRLLSPLARKAIQRALIQSGVQIASPKGTTTQP